MGFLDQILLPVFDTLEKTAELQFDGLPPGLNQTKGHHWGATNAERASWRKYAWATAKAAKAQPITDMAFLHVRIFLADRRKRDEDNMRGALKPVIDGLVDAGIIRGDSIYDIETFYSFGLVKPAGFKISIYKLP